MANWLRRILSKVTPWYDESEAKAKDVEKEQVLRHANEVSSRAERVIQQYRLADEVYRNRNRAFKWNERK